MPGERIGRFYEFLAVVAVKRAMLDAGLSSEVLWNPPKGDLMVKPDVSVSVEGTTKCIILVTRSGARRNWHQKFWRNVGEAVDLRGRLPECSVVSVSLGTELKEELVAAFGSLADASFFPNRATRRNLEEWAIPLVDALPNDDSVDEAWVRAQVLAAPGGISNVLQQLGRTVVESVGEPSETWAPLVTWLAGRSSLSTTAQEEWTQPGRYRRGLAKLLAVGRPVEVMAAIRETGTEGLFEIDMAYAAALRANGWGAEETITGCYIGDPDIKTVLSGWGTETTCQVLDAATSPEIAKIRADIESQALLDSTYEFVRDHVQDLRSADWVESQLVLSRTDPSMNGAIRSVPAGLSGVWMFRVLMSLCKFASGRKQGFGYEQFIAKVRDFRADASVPARLVSMGATEAQVFKAGTTDSYRRKLVDWVSGLRPAKLAAWQVRLAAEVFTVVLADYNEAQLRRAAGSLPDFIRRLTYEDRLAPYRYFEPLKERVEQVLESAGIDFDFVPRHDSLISDLAAGSRKAGTTPVIRVGRTLIHWKSAHDSHPPDKTKELCGRAFSLKHRLRGDHLVAVPEVERLVLCLDGDFKAEHVRHLARAGWDIVTSPGNLKCLPQLFD